jgi:hypothetical protein
MIALYKVIIMSRGILRAEKRKKQKEENYFFGMVKTALHFFPKLWDKLAGVKDPRHQSYITYGVLEMLVAVILKNAAGIESMRQMDRAFNTDECIENVYKVLGMSPRENLPQHDTLNDLLEQAAPEEIAGVRNYMTGCLLSGRALERYRLPGKKWGILFDGTGLFSFPERHCEHCLKRVTTNPKTGEKKTVYMHHVLEAKLLAGDMVFSLDSEFIENESEDVLKQDCELKAFYRMAERLKRKYPRLPVCVIGDSLYACDPVFELCGRNNWDYLIRFKDGSIPTVAREFEALRKIADGVELDKSGTCRYANSLATARCEVNCLSQEVEVEGKLKQYIFLTSMGITKRNAEKIAEAGRARWKIENEGFNIQKNHRCFIEHAFSENYNAMKCHYLLAQIAEIIMQLYENGAELFKTIQHGVKEISSLLLESLRTRIFTDEDIKKLDVPMQIRFV